MIDISRHGIIFRPDEGDVVVIAPDRNGGAATIREIDQAFAEAQRLSTGDIVADSDGARTINGVGLEEARDRPLPRPKRNALERSAPDTRIPISVGRNDLTGRTIEFSAPLGRGQSGIIYGPHGTGLTHTLRSVVKGALTNRPELTVIVLLVGTRGEEITDWRRQLPMADIVVCPLALADASADDTIFVADLVLACAQRQTELGRHVLLAVDSLTGLWAAMLELEEADAQREADRATARQRIREWMQCAGEFGGEGLLGSGLGGSLTIVGTAWYQGIDVEAEEEGESHPHLRLIEHVLNETDWRAPLSGLLASQRLYPAVDVMRCLSAHEASLLPADGNSHRSRARRALAGLSVKDCYVTVVRAIEATGDEAQLNALIAGPETVEEAEEDDDFWKGLKIDGV